MYAINKMKIEALKKIGWNGMNYVTKKILGELKWWKD
jgi:hypothetical protein